MGGCEYNVDGTEVICGVRKTEVHDPATNTWTTKAPLPKGRHDVAASTAMLNGQSRIHIVGGTRPGNNVAYILNLTATQTAGNRRKTSQCGPFCP